MVQTSLRFWQTDHLPLLKWRVSRSGEGYKESFPHTQLQCLLNWFSHFQWENTEETLEITFQPYMRPDFATPLLVFPRNDDWRASREIPYWWHVTAHFRVVPKWGKTPPPRWVNGKAPGHGLCWTTSATSGYLKMMEDQWRRHLGCIFNGKGGKLKSWEKG